MTDFVLHISVLFESYNLNAKPEFELTVPDSTSNINVCVVPSDVLSKVIVPDLKFAEFKLVVSPRIIPSM